MEVRLKNVFFLIFFLIICLKKVLSLIQERIECTIPVNKSRLTDNYFKNNDTMKIDNAYKILNCDYFSDHFNKSLPYLSTNTTDKFNKIIKCQRLSNKISKYIYLSNEEFCISLKNVRKNLNLNNRKSNQSPYNKTEISVKILESSNGNSSFLKLTLLREKFNEKRELQPSSSIQSVLYIEASVSVNPTPIGNYRNIAYVPASAIKTQIILLADYLNNTIKLTSLTLTPTDTLQSVFGLSLRGFSCKNIGYSTVYIAATSHIVFFRQYDERPNPPECSTDTTPYDAMMYLYQVSGNAMTLVNYSNKKFDFVGTIGMKSLNIMQISSTAMFVVSLAGFIDNSNNYVLGVYFDPLPLSANSIILTYSSRPANYFHFKYTNNQEIYTYTKSLGIISSANVVFICFLKKPTGSNYYSLLIQFIDLNQLTGSPKNMQQTVEFAIPSLDLTRSSPIILNDFNVLTNQIYIVVSYCIPTGLGCNKLAKGYIVSYDISQDPPVFNVQQRSFTFDRIAEAHVLVNVLSQSNFILVCGKDSGNTAVAQTYTISSENIFVLFASTNVASQGTSADKFIAANYFTIFDQSVTPAITKIMVSLIYVDSIGSEKVVQLASCLFWKTLVKDATVTSCVISCISGRDAADLATQTCTTCINLLDNKYLHNNQCVMECPPFYIPDSNNLCFLCKEKKPSTPYSLFPNKICVSSCPAGNLIVRDYVNFSCNDCKAGKLLFRNNTCVSNCDASTDVIDSSNGVCYACKQDNKFYYSGACHDSPPKYGYIASNITNNCILCSDFQPPQYYFNKECYSECPTGTALHQNGLSCEKCKTLGKVDMLGTCYNQCFTNYDYDSDGICLPCNKLNKYNFNGTCVFNCPIYTVKDQSSCIDCKSKDLYYVYVNKISSCEKKCPENLAPDSNKICYNCTEKNMVYCAGNCYNKCPDGYGRGESYICRDCSVLGYFSYEEKCVTKCPDYTYIEPITKSCLTCPKGKLKYKSSCVDTCPEGSVFNNVNQYCRKCGDENKYYYKNKCIKQCPPYSNIQEDICIYCKDYNLFYFNNACLNLCPAGTIPNYVSNSCVGSNNSTIGCMNGGIEKDNKCECKNNYFGDICQYTMNDVKDIVKIYGNRYIKYRKTNAFSKSSNCK